MKILVLCVSLCLAASVLLQSRTCLETNVGNGVCNDECNTYTFRFDGGDCGVTCPMAWMGDGQCDDLCNSEQYRWDAGDCPKK